MVLIISDSLRRTKENTMWISPLIRSYALSKALVDGVDSDQMI